MDGRQEEGSMSFSRRCFLPLSLALSVTGLRAAASTAPAAETAELSLEELINIEVTSVGKKETTLLRAPAAIAVLTAEDFDRLGANSIPEALRAVPGMHVARMSGNRWAVSARGMNDEYSNKLLVMVDGRSVYSPLFGGVHWNVQDIVLEDLDRIEINRGPGGTLWGANAVNGVINIITKSARETQGALVSTIVGTEDQPTVSARYGGTLASNVYYRVYTKYLNREGFENTDGTEAGDDWDIARGGLRLDWEASEQNTFTLQGDYYGGQFGEQVGKSVVFPTPDYRHVDVDADVRGGNVLGRWTSRFSEDSELSLQFYYDHYLREHPFGGGVLLPGPNEFAPSQNMLTEKRDTWDFDLQHRFRVLNRNEIVWGLGFRRTQDSIDPGGSETFWTRRRAADDLFSAFVQDEITLVENRLSLTVGTKLEHNDYTGLEFQPGGRLLWTPTDKQSIWASVSRAVRTPTRLERDVRVNIDAFPPSGPMIPAVLASAVPNPNAESETMMAYELGYRWEPTRKVSFDAAVFFNSYDWLAASPAGTTFQMDPVPHLSAQYVTDNDADGYAYGAELLTKWQPTSDWRLTAGYTFWEGYSDRSHSIIGTNPEHQFHLHSSLDLGRGVTLDKALYFVDDIHALSQHEVNAGSIPSYVRLDVGVTWQASPNLEFAVWGQNLLDEGHPEFASYKSARQAEIPRSVFGRMTLRF